LSETVCPYNGIIKEVLYVMGPGVPFYVCTHTPQIGDESDTNTHIVMFNCVKCTGGDSRLSLW